MNKKLIIGLSVVATAVLGTAIYMKTAYVNSTAEDIIKKVFVKINEVKSIGEVKCRGGYSDLTCDLKNVVFYKNNDKYEVPLATIVHPMKFIKNKELLYNGKGYKPGYKGSYTITLNNLKRNGVLINKDFVDNFEVKLGANKNKPIDSTKFKEFLYSNFGKENKIVITNKVNIDNLELFSHDKVTFIIGKNTIKGEIHTSMTKEAAQILIDKNIPS